MSNALCSKIDVEKGGKNFLSELFGEIFNEMTHLLSKEIRLIQLARTNWNCRESKFSIRNCKSNLSSPGSPSVLNISIFKINMNINCNKNIETVLYCDHLFHFIVYSYFKGGLYSSYI